jgi:dCMP deaminase
VLLYLPVIHAGYERFLDRHRDAVSVLLLGSTFAADYPAMTKEIRALPPARAAEYLVSAGYPARVVEVDDLPDAVNGNLLVVPDEEIMRSLVAAYGFDAVFERTFLRWDRAWSAAGRPASFTGSVSAEDVDRRFAALATDEATRSSDWWRQVGAVAVRSGSVLLSAHNEHRPTEYTPYVDGDPRNDYSRGVRTDLSTAIHAEAAIVARAARDGLSLRDAEIYVTTFPCPACARLIAEAGFARCYFAGPYAVLDGDEILRAAGVELIWVSPGPESSP